jgi:hypothetical protein
MAQSTEKRLVESGFKLVPKDKVGRRLVTMRELARVDFKPLGGKPGQVKPSDRDLANCGVPCRMASMLVRLSREEMLELQRKWKKEEVGEAIEALIDTAEWLKCGVYVLEAAYKRLIVTAAAHDLAEKKRSRGIRHRRS